MTTNVRSTYFYDGPDSPSTSVTKDLSPSLVKDTIREFIFKQYRYIYNVNPEQSILERLVNGFMLFNLYKNMDMLISKERLNEYINDKNVSTEEILYFLDIVLYIQKPNFLTQDELEHIRAIGTLDNYCRSY
jgi:hypothetical protein